MPLCDSALADTLRVSRVSFLECRSQPRTTVDIFHSSSARALLTLPMNRILSIALLCIGLVLVVYGLNALDSVSSSFSRLFTGSPTEKSIWLLIGGIVLTLIGAGGVVRNPRAN